MALLDAVAWTDKCAGEEIEQFIGTRAAHNQRGIANQAWRICNEKTSDNTRGPLRSL
jgi:hypothetical protein